MFKCSVQCLLYEPKQYKIKKDETILKYSKIIIQHLKCVWEKLPYKIYQKGIKNLQLKLSLFEVN